MILVLYVGSREGGRRGEGSCVIWIAYFKQERF